MFVNGLLKLTSLGVLIAVLGCIERYGASQCLDLLGHGPHALSFVAGTKNATDLPILVIMLLFLFHLFKVLIRTILEILTTV